MTATTSAMVREIFTAIQGEGARTGEATVFVRLAGCNLDCAFCDTDWRHGARWSITNLVQQVERYAMGKVEWVCLTGGEPCAAPAFDDLVEALHGAGFRVSVETNGTRWRDGLLESHVVVSPKARWEGPAAALANLQPLDEGKNQYGRELKIVIDGDETVADLDAALQRCTFSPTHLFVQPIYERRKAWERAVALVYERPQWRLSVQVQKWIGCR